MTVTSNPYHKIIIKKKELSSFCTFSVETVHEMTRLGDEEKLLFTKECQHKIIVTMLQLENQYFAVINEIIYSGRFYQWMQKPLVSSICLMQREMFTLTKYNSGYHHL